MNIIKIWNLESGTLIVSLTGHTSEIWKLAISSDNKFIISGDGLGIIKIWDL